MWICLQLFWEKRLENLKFLTGNEEDSRLPPSIKPVGPYVNSDTALQVIIFFSLNVRPNWSQWYWEMCIVYIVAGFIPAHGHPRSVDNGADWIEIGLGKERRGVSQPWSAIGSGIVFLSFLLPYCNYAAYLLFRVLWYQRAIFASKKKEFCLPAWDSKKPSVRCDDLFSCLATMETNNTRK